MTNLTTPARCCPDASLARAAKRTSSAWSTSTHQYAIPTPAVLRELEARDPDRCAGPAIGGPSAGRPPRPPVPRSRYSFACRASSLRLRCEVSFHPHLKDRSSSIFKVPLFSSNSDRMSRIFDRLSRAVAAVKANTPLACGSSDLVAAALNTGRASAASHAASRWAARASRGMG